MPRYSYECIHCKHIIDTEHNIHTKYRNMWCVKCGKWARVKRLLGAPKFIIHGYSAKNSYQGDKDAQSN